MILTLAEIYIQDWSPQQHEFHCTQPQTLIQIREHCQHVRSTQRVFQHICELCNNYNLYSEGKTQGRWKSA